MYKPSTYLVITYLPTYPPMYQTYFFFTELVTKVKPNIDLVEVHPQLSNNKHLVDGALVGADLPWPRQRTGVSALSLSLAKKPKVQVDLHMHSAHSSPSSLCSVNNKTIWAGST